MRLPTQSNAVAAIEGIKNCPSAPITIQAEMIRTQNLTFGAHTRVDSMISMLSMFTNLQSVTYNRWGTSMYQAAIGMGWGKHCNSVALWAESCILFTDHKILPINPYGDWNKSLLVNETSWMKSAFTLLSLGNELTAKSLMDFPPTKWISRRNMESNVISPIKWCAGIFRCLATITNLHQRDSMLMGHEREGCCYLPGESIPSKIRAINLVPRQISILCSQLAEKRGGITRMPVQKPYTKGKRSILDDYKILFQQDFGWLSSPNPRTIRMTTSFRPGKKLGWGISQMKISSSKRIGPPKILPGILP